MSNPLRPKLIRLAASLPKGSKERKSLLHILATSKDAGFVNTYIDDAVHHVAKGRDILLNWLLRQEERMGESEAYRDPDVQAVDRVYDDLEKVLNAMVAAGRKIR